METVERYGVPVVSQLVYARTKEQRDFWKERADCLAKINTRLTARVERLEKILRDARDAFARDAGTEHG